MSTSETKSFPTRARGTSATTDKVELPIVIRPRPLRLEELERRVRLDGELAQQLATRIDFCATLARVLLARDGQARARFADSGALIIHLQSLVGG